MEQAHTQLIAQLNERILAADNTPLYINRNAGIGSRSFQFIYQLHQQGII